MVRSSGSAALMNLPDERPEIRFRSRRARLEVCAEDNTLVLSIGPVSLRIDRETAEEVLVLLADVLGDGDPDELTPEPSS